MLGPFATASRRTPIHQVSLLSHAATVTRRLRIDVHDNDDNDNAWQTAMAPYIEWAQWMVYVLPSVTVDCDYVVQQKGEMGAWRDGYLHAEANPDCSILRSQTLWRKTVGMWKNEFCTSAAIVWETVPAVH